MPEDLRKPSGQETNVCKITIFKEGLAPLMTNYHCQIAISLDAAGLPSNRTSRISTFSYLSVQVFFRKLDIDIFL